MLFMLVSMLDAEPTCLDSGTIAVTERLHCPQQNGPSQCKQTQCALECREFKKTTGKIPFSCIKEYSLVIDSFQWGWGTINKKTREETKRQEKKDKCGLDSSVKQLLLL